MHLEILKKDVHIVNYKRFIKSKKQQTKINNLASNENLN